MCFRSLVHCVYTVLDRMEKKVSVKKMQKNKRKKKCQHSNCKGGLKQNDVLFL